MVYHPMLCARWDLMTSWRSFPTLVISHHQWPRHFGSRRSEGDGRLMAESQDRLSSQAESTRVWQTWVNGTVFDTENARVRRKRRIAMNTQFSLTTCAAFQGTTMTHCLFFALPLFCWFSAFFVDSRIGQFIDFFVQSLKFIGFLSQLGRMLEQRYSAGELRPRIWCESNRPWNRSAGIK